VEEREKKRENIAGGSLTARLGEASQSLLVGLHRLNRRHPVCNGAEADAKGQHATDQRAVLLSISNSLSN